MDSSLLASKSKEGEYEQGIADVTLRPIEISDIDDFMVWASDEKTAEFCIWEPYTSREDSMNFINNMVTSHPWYKAICLNGRPIGSISVRKEYDLLTPTFRGIIGYAISSKYWGQGITTKAVRLVLKTIFNEWPEMERLQALVDVDNGASQKVLEKCGFKKEGILRKYLVLKGRRRDMAIYSFLSTDPLVSGL